MIALHVCISGFRERIGDASGIFDLEQELVNDCHFCNGHSRVWHYTWRYNWRELAEEFWNITKRLQGEPLIAVYAYSWGAGWGAMELARQLGRLGMGVRAMVLSDPVYHHPLFFMRWKALLGRRLVFGTPIIQVPGNVREVWSFHQEVTRPQGHMLAQEGDDTVMHKPVLLSLPHVKMDEASEFHAKVLEVANQIRSESGYSVCQQRICPPSKR